MDTSDKIILTLSAPFVLHRIWVIAKWFRATPKDDKKEVLDSLWTLGFYTLIIIGIAMGGMSKE